MTETDRCLMCKCKKPVQFFSQPGWCTTCTITNAIDPDDLMARSKSRNEHRLVSIGRTREWWARQRGKCKCRRRLTSWWYFSPYGPGGRVTRLVCHVCHANHVQRTAWKNWFKTGSKASAPGRRIEDAVADKVERNRLMAIKFAMENNLAIPNHIAEAYKGVDIDELLGHTDKDKEGENEIHEK